jgi:hypothetical protein
MSTTNNLPVHKVTSIFLDRDLIVSDTFHNGKNNRFLLDFGRQISTTENSMMAVSNFSVPYSWFNITTVLENNLYYYVWYDADSTSTDFPSGAASGGNVFAVSLSDGYYSLTEMNAYLQWIMIKNGHYLVDSNGNYIYFLEIVYNVNKYRFQLNSYPLPSTLPVGWSNPAGVIVFDHIGAINTPVNGYYYCPKMLLPKISLLSNNIFTYFGFDDSASLLTALSIGNVRILPATTTPPVGFTSIAVLGENAPAQTPIHSICLTCEKYIDNPLRSNSVHQVSSFVLTTQNINNTFGADIQNSIFFLNWIPLLKNQEMKKIEFRLIDQDGNDLYLQDNDVSIEIIITDLRY